MARQLKQRKTGLPRVLFRARQSRKILITLLLLFTLSFFLTQKTFATPSPDIYPFTSTKEAERFRLLTEEIRCVVCQNQNIADSNAPLANDLRDKVYKMVAEKKSNAEIKQYLVKRYGEFILLKPKFDKLTVFLWLFPFLCLLTFSLFIVFMNQKNR